MQKEVLLGLHVLKRCSFAFHFFFVISVFLWSSISNKIVCTVRVDGGKFQVATCDPAGTATQVSKARFDGIEPSWLADGRHVIFTARDKTTSALCILDTETGKITPISPASFGPAMQASVWTP